MAISTCWKSTAWRPASCISTIRSATGRKPVAATPAEIMRLDGAGVLAAGGPADFVIFRGRSWTELLSRPESDRIVVRDGSAIERDIPDYAELDDLMGDVMDIAALKRDLDGSEDRGQSEDRPAEEPRLLLVQPGAEAPARPCHRRSRRLAEERGRGDPRARRLPPARRSGHAARHRHRQLRPGDAAVRRRRASLAEMNAVTVDLARPRRRRPGRHPRRHRPRDARAFRPGTAAASLDLQHRLDRRLHRRRLRRRRLDQFRRLARFRQRAPAARRHHGGRARSVLELTGEDAAQGHACLRHQRHHHRGRDAADGRL